MKSSGFSAANIDFQLDAHPNAYVSYCFRLMRLAKDCDEPILMYSRPTMNRLKNYVKTIIINFRLNTVLPFRLVALLLLFRSGMTFEVKNCCHA